MEKRVRLEGGEPCPPPPSEDPLADLIRRLDELIRLLTRLLELPPPAIPGFDGRLDELAKFVRLVPFDWGKSAGGNLNMLVAPGKNWTTDIWAGSWIGIIDGTGKGQLRRVASNTIDRIIPETPFIEAPDTTSVYVLWRSETASIDKLIANQHQKLEIDLATPRTDETISASVNGFLILSRSGGATFGIKLGEDSDYLTDADLSDKEGIMEFAPSNLIMTNTAQPGRSVTILTLRKV